MSKRYKLIPFSIMFLIISGCSFKQIPPAHVGVKFSGTSGISEQIIKPEVVFVGPNDRLIVYPTGYHNATYVKRAGEGEKNEDDSIKATTNEGAILPVDLTVTYHIDPADLGKIFDNFGTDNIDYIQKTFLRHITVAGVNIVSGQESIFALISTDRQKFGPQVKDRITPILKEIGISVDNVLIGEVYPPKEVLDKAQELVNAKNELATRNQSLRSVQVEAQTRLIQANQQAQQNQLLSQQGDKVLQMKKLELRKKAIEKWDGESPMTGSGVVPFTNVKVR